MLTVAAGTTSDTVLYHRQGHRLATTCRVVTILLLHPRRLLRQLRW